MKRTTIDIMISHMYSGGPTPPYLIRVPGYQVDHEMFDMVVHRPVQFKSYENGEWKEAYLDETQWIVSERVTGHRVVNSNMSYRSRVLAVNKAKELVNKPGSREKIAAKMLQVSAQRVLSLPIMRFDFSQEKTK